MARQISPNSSQYRHQVVIFGFYGALGTASLAFACSENTERVLSKTPEATTSAGTGAAAGGASSTPAGGSTPTPAGGTTSSTTGGTSTILTGPAMGALGNPIGYASIGTGGTSGGRTQPVILVRTCAELESALTTDNSLAVVAIEANKTLDCSDPNPAPNCAGAELDAGIAGCSITCKITCDSTTGDTTRPTFRPLDPSYANCSALKGSNSSYTADTPMVPMANTVKKIYVNSNKTLLGLNAASTLKGANLYLNSETSNVVIQNLNFDQVNPAMIEAGDAITIDGANHIWVDHCKFSNVSDGDIDVTNGTYVTYSWNHFYGINNYACAGKQNSASTISGSGQSTVTLHHNYFNNTLGCSPKVTDTSKVHIFNNVWQSVAYYSIQAANQAQATVQNNFFSDSKKPYYGSDSCLTKTPPCAISASGNQFDGISTTETQDNAGSVTPLPYESTTYTLDDATKTGSKDSVTQYVGPTLTFSSP